MIRVLIIDDEPLVRERVRDLMSLHPELELLKECTNGADAVTDILDLQPDLVFLDVRMPELDGFEVLEAVAGQFLPAVVFITAYDEHALRAFDFHALDYLLKPIDPGRFERTVRRAVLLVQSVSSGGLPALLAARRRAGPCERLVARRGRSHVIVRVEEIDWIEGAGNYLRLHTAAGEGLVRETMKALGAQLDPACFLRIHRSTIVNVRRIEAVTPAVHGEYELKLRSGELLRSSRTYGAALRGLLEGGLP